MAEIHASDNRSQRRVFIDGGEELAEDARVRDGNMAVEGIKCRGVDGSRGHEERHEVGISCGKPIRRDLNDEQIDDGTCKGTSSQSLEST